MLEQYGLMIALACAVVAILYGIISARWINRFWCACSMHWLPRMVPCCLA